MESQHSEGVDQIMHEEAGPTVDIGLSLLEDLEVSLNFRGTLQGNDADAHSEPLNESSVNEGTTESSAVDMVDESQPSVDPDSPETQPVRITCNYANLGCKSTFAKYAERTRHAKKCIYSIFKCCKDSKCVANGTAAFKDLKELVTHSIERHGCVQVKSSGEIVILPFCLPKKFLEHKGKDFNVKLLSLFEIENDTGTFRILLVVMMKDQTLHFVTVLLCGSSSKCDDYARVKLELMDSMGNAIPVIGSLAHPSHSLDNGTKVLTCAIGNLGRVFEGIKKKMFARFAKKTISESVDNSGMTNLKLKLNADPFRCQLLTDNVSPLQPYFLSWQETGLDDCIKDALYGDNVIGNEQRWRIPELTGALIPQLMDKADILIECNEIKQVLNSCLATVISLKNGRPKSGRMGRFWKAIVLFPNISLLRAQETSLYQKAEATGLKIGSLIDNADKEMLERIDECDLIMTTLKGLLIGNNSSVLFDKVKFIIVPNADYILKDEHASEKLRNCLAVIPKKKKVKLVQIAICQDVNQRLLSELQGKFFDKNFKAISIGEALYDIADILKVSMHFSPTFDITVTSVIEIIGSYTESSSSCRGGWLVIADERQEDYVERFDAIITKLSELPTEKQWGILRCDEHDANESVPIEFQRFQEESDGVVLLTSYFALNFEQVKNCEAIIVIKEAEAIFGNVEMQSLFRLITNSNGEKKPAYCLFD